MQLSLHTEIKEVRVCVGCY